MTTTINLGKGASITLTTTLTKSQVAKFAGLAKNIVVVDDLPYIPTEYLHGALLTNSKAQAQEIIQANRDILKAHLFKGNLKPMGLYLLLEHLANVNAQRADDYRASLCLVTAIVAQQSKVMAADRARAKAQEAAIKAAMSQLKLKHKVCQVSGKFFEGEQKHVHHLLGRAENPQQAAEVSNLVVIRGDIHQGYHAWLKKKGWSVCPHTLGLYAIRCGYNGPFIQELEQGGWALVG